MVFSEILVTFTAARRQVIRVFGKYQLDCPSPAVFSTHSVSLEQHEEQRLAEMISLTAT